MNFRRIGDTGIECSIIGLGTGRLASVSGGISRAEAGRLLGVAEDCGINLIDTADSYGRGGSERMIGLGLQGRRDKFVITTKAGFYFSPLGGGLLLIKPLAKRLLKYFKSGKKLASNVRANVSRQDFSSLAIRNCITASLQRLRTDHIDIFLLHSPPAPVMADAPLFEMLRLLQREGKIRRFGVSSPDPAVLDSALRVAGLAVVETPLNPAQTAHQAGLPRLAAASIGVVANEIFLAGKLLASQAAPGGEDGEILRIKTGVDALAAAKGISSRRLLMQYALMQPGVVSVLTGTTRAEHLKQNVADALSPAVLSAEDIAIMTGKEAVPVNLR